MCSPQILRLSLYLVSLKRRGLWVLHILFLEIHLTTGLKKKKMVAMMIISFYQGRSLVHVLAELLIFVGLGEMLFSLFLSTGLCAVSSKQ